jgi:hypothetical protein
METRVTGWRNIKIFLGIKVDWSGKEGENESVDYLKVRVATAGQRLLIPITHHSENRDLFP